MDFNKRITRLNDAPVRRSASYVLYWMQTARRAESNEALDYAITQANMLKLPLLVYEELKYDMPYACDRHHFFVLENAFELKSRLARKGIRYIFRLERSRSDRIPVVRQLSARAALTISDDFPSGYIRQRNLTTAANVNVAFLVADSNGIVPLNAMNKQEYAARTIRPKIHRLLSECLQPRSQTSLDIDSSHLKLDLEETPLASRSIEAWVAACDIRHDVPRSSLFKGGYSQVRHRLMEFTNSKLNAYSQNRNNPSLDGTSGLSPYLHHGVISSREVVQQIKAAGKDTTSTEAFLEELIVRRELSYNFTKYNDDHEEISGLPRWVRQNLSKHAQDRRLHIYTLRQFEFAQTHDSIWNACQLELSSTGRIHGYMRMYWGKKIIEWSRTYSEALQTMIYLNNQYAVDGCNPNSWTGILWCFGLHDRPWGERPVFGTIRYMSSDSLRRKVDVGSYIERVQQGAKDQLFLLKH